MADFLPSDSSDLEVENSIEDAESDDESDISVSTVNTEDLSELEFSDDDEEVCEIGWSRDPAPVNVTPFTSRSGAVSGVAEDGTAKDFFQLFVSEELFDMIVEETNRYASQCIARKPDAKWHDTNREEMQAFIGLHVLFGYHKLPETALYWSKEETLGVAYVKKVMPRDRFDKLTQYLHLNNNENAVPRGQPNHDKLFKVRPFLEAVVKACREEYRPTQNLSVDEAMVAFKGQLSLKQYMPLKPIKRGIKVWVCADASNGYITNLQVYTGKQDGGVAEHGLGYRVVRELSQPFVGKNHHIFCDNFFTSIKLACDLLRDETYLCGTIRANRRGFPKALSPQRPEIKALRKGESKFYRRGNLVASVWKDTKLVCFLSTESNPVGDETVNRRQRDGTIVQVPTVPSAISYNKNMGGVDLSDQKRNYYAVGRKTRKWWRYLLWFFIDSSIVNAHILETEAQNHRSRSQMQFRVELAKMLVGEFSSRSRSVSEGQITNGHWPVEASKGRCKRCLKQKRNKFCRMACMACGKRICLECFPNHSENDL